MSTRSGDSERAGSSGETLGAGADPVVPPPGVIAILDQLAALATTAPRVPWSSRAVVDAEELAALVTELRERLPRDLEEAHQIVTERETILLEAEVSARDLLSEAEAEAERLVRQHSITRQAEDRANRLLADAERRAEQELARARQEAASLTEVAAAEAQAQRAAADDYSLDVLRRLETQLVGFVASVRKGIAALEPGEPGELGESRVTHHESPTPRPRE